MELKQLMSGFDRAPATNGCLALGLGVAQPAWIEMGQLTAGFDGTWLADSWLGCVRAGFVQLGQRAAGLDRGWVSDGRLGLDSGSWRLAWVELGQLTPVSGMSRTAWV